MDSNNDPKRVVLDAYWWSRGTKSLQNVVRGLTKAWIDEFPNDHVTLVVPRHHVEQVRDSIAADRVVGTRLWPQALSAGLAVSWVAARSKADILITHNFTALLGSPRRAVYIQDLIFESNPEWFSRKELLYFRWMTRTSRRADVIFSSTSTEKLRIHSRCKRTPVVAVGMGVEANDSFPEHDDSKQRDLSVGHFILTVGRLNVRKNLHNTLEGIYRTGLLSSQFPLVIVGKRDGAWSEFPPWVKKAESNGEVRFTGFIPDRELGWLLRSCRLFVSLSLDEGFGLPPVEARIAGAEVLVSDIPVYRETLGDEATFVDPLSVAAISDAVTALLGEAGPNIPSSYLRNQYSWPAVAQRMRRELTVSDRL